MLNIKENSYTSKSAQTCLQWYLEGRDANWAAAAAVVITK